MARRGPSTARATDVGAEPGTGYRPHLDGIRTVAVYLVLVFHAGADRLTGGFIGVDVFFVLSGYLVTQLLLRDLSGHGRVRFGRFYARRMRRLLPASLVALVVTAVVYSALAAPAEVASAVGGVKASFLYVANWYFIHRSADYFAPAIERSPVIHFWSLAVEEQFYLLWPVLLAALFAGTRRLGAQAHRARQAIVVGGGLASVVWALSRAGSDLNRAYYGTDARAYQLLVGAVLALSPGLLRRAATHRALAGAAAGLALLALGVLATSVLDVNAIQRGVAATVVTLVLLVALESRPGGTVGRVLSWEPIAYLGRISYGTYLWHWPVILFTGLLTDDRTTPTSTIAVAALVATGLASLSFTVLERPIREQRRLDRLAPAVIATGLAVGLVAALVVVPRVLDPYRTPGGEAARPVGSAVSGVPVAGLDFAGAELDVGPGLRDVPFLDDWTCRDEPVARCTIVHGSGPHVLVIGDSSAAAVFPTFAAMAKAEGFTLSTEAAPGCPWQRNLYLADTRGPLGRRTARCGLFKRDLYDRVIPALHPDVIVTMSADYLDYTTNRPGAVHDASGQPIPAATRAEFQAQFAAETRRSLDRLGATAKTVVVLDPIPIATVAEDPFVCLTKATVVDECRFIVDDGSDQLDSVYKALAEDRRVQVVDLDRLVCPYLPICDPVVNGEIVRWDPQHLTPRFAATLAGPVAKILQADGVLPP